MPALTALALNCSLKPSPAPSSCQLLIDHLLAHLADHDVEGETIRVVDHDVKPGVTSDEGEGDAWPAIREQILAADILVFGTPIWMGHPTSVAQRVMERMDAFLSETDDLGRMVSVDIVACVAVVGNEDGAHHVFADVGQALSDVGFTIPTSGSTYWVGEAMQTTDLNDLPQIPEKTAESTATLARNAAHLARLLAGDGYPGDV
ncbi:MAG: NAD(P)H-dependent oxidoreductase [Solirubrobacteraceae bacterium]